MSEIKIEQDFKEALLGLGLKDTSESYDDDNSYFEKYPVCLLFRNKSQIDGAEFDGSINIFTNPRFEFTTSRHMEVISSLTFLGVYELLIHQIKLNKVEGLNIAKKDWENLQNKLEK